LCCKVAGCGRFTGLKTAVMWSKMVGVFLVNNSFIRAVNLKGIRLCWRATCEQ